MLAGSLADLHPVSDSGAHLDATFDLEQVPVVELVFHHKSGARNSPRSKNADYHQALELLLQRLATLGASILSVSVESQVALELDAADRELDLPFPIDLSTVDDLSALRLDITRAQKPVARRPGSLPGGGNDQKRIKLTITLSATQMALGDLGERLVVGPSPAGLPDAVTRP